MPCNPRNRVHLFPRRECSSNPDAWPGHSGLVREFLDRPELVVIECRFPEAAVAISAGIHERFEIAVAYLKLIYKILAQLDACLSGASVVAEAILACRNSGHLLWDLRSLSQFLLDVNFPRRLGHQAEALERARN